jgi:hypothetical protein
MSDCPTPASLSAVQSRIEDLADQAGIAGNARMSVAETLAALPWLFRRRLVLTLQSLKAFSPDPDLQRAAEFFQLRAAEVWAAMPFEGHRDGQASETAVLIKREAERRMAAHTKKP